MGADVETGATNRMQLLKSELKKAQNVWSANADEQLRTEVNTAIEICESLFLETKDAEVLKSSGVFSLSMVVV